MNGRGPDAEGHMLASSAFTAAGEQPQSFHRPGVRIIPEARTQRVSLDNVGRWNGGQIAAAAASKTGSRR